MKRIGRVARALFLAPPDLSRNEVSRAWRRSETVLACAQGAESACRIGHTWSVLQRVGRVAVAFDATIIRLRSLFVDTLAALCDLQFENGEWTKNT